MPGRACRCTAGARILVVRVRLPGAGRRGPAPPSGVEILNQDTRPQASLHHDASLRRDLGLDLLDRLWERNEMSDDEAIEVAVEAQHKTRPKRR